MTRDYDLAMIAKELDEKEAWIRSQIKTPDMYRRIGFFSEASKLEDKIRQTHDEIKKLVEKYKKIQGKVR